MNDNYFDSSKSSDAPVPTWPPQNSANNNGGNPGQSTPAINPQETNPPWPQAPSVGSSLSIPTNMTSGVSEPTPTSMEQTQNQPTAIPGWMQNESFPAPVETLSPSVDPPPSDTPFQTPTSSASKEMLHPTPDSPPSYTPQADHMPQDPSLSSSPFNIEPASTSLSQGTTSATDIPDDTSFSSNITPFTIPESSTTSVEQPANTSNNHYMTEVAPTDLSQLTSNPTPQTMQTEGLNTQTNGSETVVLPQSQSSMSPETVNAGHKLPLPLIIGGVVVILALAAVSAYFAFGVGQTQLNTNISLPIEQPAPTISKEPANNGEDTSSESNPSTTFGDLNPTPTAVSTGSALDRLRQRATTPTP